MTRSRSDTAPDMAQVMDGVARRLNEPVPVQDVLSRIVQSAVQTVPGVDHAGISVWHRNGRIRTLASTNRIVLELDELQYRFREGPCVDAMRGAGECWVQDLSVETRWPRYGPRAVALGVVSHLGLELFAEDKTVGGLNLYAEAAHAFDRDTPTIAHLFATHAAHAMGRAMKQEQLSESVASRTVIGQALGIVMERYLVDDDRAFDFLRRTSQDTNTRLVEVARRIVADASTAARES